MKKNGGTPWARDEIRRVGTVGDGRPNRTRTLPAVWGDETREKGKMASDLALIRG